MFCLSSLPRRYLILIAAAAVLALVSSLMFAPLSFAAPAGGATLPEDIARNFRQMVTGTAGQVVIVLLIGGILWILRPGQQSIPKLVGFLLVMAVIIMPVVMASGTVSKELKEFGTNMWSRAGGGGGGGGTP